MIVVALFLPVLALPIAWRAPSTMTARRVGGYLALAAAALWLVMLVLDPGASFGRFGVAPGAIGAWLLVASITFPTRRLPLALAIVAGGVTAGGLSLVAGAGDLSDAAGALALAAVVVSIAARVEGDHALAPAIACALGAAAIAIGLTRLEADTGGFVQGGGLPVVLGAALAVAAAGGRARRTGVVVLPLALLLGIQAAAVLDGGMRVALVLALVGAVATRWPGAALGCWALAAAVVSLPAALLLGSAAVLVAALPHPIAPVTALPGAAALAVALAHGGSRSAVVLAALAAITVARLWRDDHGDVIGGRPSEPTFAAVVVGSWLLVAPETWSWVGSAELAQWGTAMVIAVIVGGIGAFVLFSFSDEPFSLPDMEVADPAYLPGEQRWAWPMALVSLAILGLSGAALVASAAS